MKRRWSIRLVAAAVACAAAYPALATVFLSVVAIEPGQADFPSRANSFTTCHVVLLADPANYPEYEWFSWPDWAPSGDRLVFEGKRANTAHDVYDLLTVDATGHDLRVILADPAPSGGWAYGIPRYSHDGQLIAMHAQTNVPTGQWGLGVCSADGTDFRCWTAAGPPWNYVVPDWSPDDTQILVSDSLATVGQLYFFDLASEQLLAGPPGCRATFGPAHPDWRIIRFYGTFQIIDTDGNVLVALGLGGNAPAWSPDGRLIAYVDHGYLHVVRSDGSDNSSLGEAGDVPRWSPENRSLVFTKNGKIWRLELIDASTSQDCNQNGAPDHCDVVTGVSTDFNRNDVPDECEGLGDLNCDSHVTYGDINPFVLALSSHDAYVATHPTCDYWHADIDGNGFVDYADINPFVRLLSRS